MQPPGPSGGHFCLLLCNSFIRARTQMDVRSFHSFILRWRRFSNNWAPGSKLKTSERRHRPSQSEIKTHTHEEGQRLLSVPLLLCKQTKSQTEES